MQVKHVPVLYIIVPCYNEEAVLPASAKTLLNKLQELTDIGEISDDSRVLFVDDGSGDQTWELIRQMHVLDCHYAGLRLSRNRGQQNAVLAGLMTAKGHADICISIDADLQDDINAIDQMLVKSKEGAQVVYGVRNTRTVDSLFKRFTAVCFYKLMQLMGVELVFNHADYRLMSKTALEALAQYREVNLFLRGLVPMIGFKTDVVYYERRARPAGESKYPLKKMFALAFDGISSFSIKPIRMISFVGGVIFAVSIFMLLWTVGVKLWSKTVPGWSSLMVSIWALGGLQLLSLGLIGEYIGKIYAETKARPRYHISETLLR